MHTNAMSASAMLSLAEAQDAVFARIVRAATVETVPLTLAHGRYVAAAVTARVDNPAFDNSAMDGYAVNSADLTRSTRLPLRGEASCGNAPARLTPGTAMRIFTGAPRPEGADAVVMQEDVRVDGNDIVFPARIRPGGHVRPRGEDFRTGDALFTPGRRLNAFDLALLAAAGVAETPVYRRPRALVIATGNELVAPGLPLAPGQIYESNRLATLIQLEALGADVTDGGVVPDDPAELRALLEASMDYDFVITSGGASVGDHDLVKQIFGEIGEIRFWRVRIKPGKPIAFGRVGTRGHFFALPGNPVSSLVTFKLFVEPALAVWHHAKPAWFELTARTQNAFKRRTGRMEFVRARLTWENGELLATALPGQGSHMLGTLRETNGLIRVAEDSAGFAAGDTVRAIPLRLDPV